MSVSSVKNLNGQTFSAVQDSSLTDFVQTNSGTYNSTYDTVSNNSATWDNVASNAILNYTTGQEINLGNGAYIQFGNSGNTIPNVKVVQSGAWYNGMGYYGAGNLSIIYYAPFAGQYSAILNPSGETENIGLKQMRGDVGVSSLLSNRTLNFYTTTGSASLNYEDISAIKTNSAYWDDTTTAVQSNSANWGYPVVEFVSNSAVATGTNILYVVTGSN